ncbi:MAG: hypothetical protein BWX47_01133 [candidate division Hyd24-12 bacterium ADurb.Bin004]|nr:MAG: hypothetical protein BWX47_01133 [candidate division Hyd24-12 bacterium ADurb.Bin004]
MPSRPAKVNASARSRTDFRYDPSNPEVLATETSTDLLEMDPRTTERGQRDASSVSTPIRKPVRSSSPVWSTSGCSVSRGSGSDGPGRLKSASGPILERAIAWSMRSGPAVRPEDAPEPIRPLRTIRIEQLDSSRVVRIGPPGDDTEAVSETVCRVMSSAASDTLEAASSM